jgi:SAM-dependent methyltransferase
MAKRNRTLNIIFPETEVGGFSRVDSTVEFYFRVNVLVKRDMIVVDLGAGRGAAFQEHPDDFKTALRNFKGKCRKVIGVDVDPAVMQNTSLDEAKLIDERGNIPLADSSVDLILSDFTFEHVAAPEEFCSEIYRILKPGGWLCARTPNKWGYIALGARLVPNRSHTKFLTVLQPERKDKDVFPTTYRLNTYGSLKKYFPDDKWNRYAYTCNPEPAYFSDSILAWRIMTTIFKFLPQRFGTAFMFFARKK